LGAVPFSFLSPTKCHRKAGVRLCAQRKRAAREAHDLAGNAQPDARTSGFGGEKKGHLCPRISLLNPGETSVHNGPFAILFLQDHLTALVHEPE